MDLADIRDASTSTKPPTADLEWSELSQAYADQSRSATAAALQKAGVGLKDNRLPIDMGGLLRQVIDRVSTVYKRPPARWLVRNGKRLLEDSEQHKVLLAALAAAEYDTAWRRVDRLRSLLGQVAIRFYPSDQRQSVVVRIFEPTQIHRVVDPACSDLMDHDQAIAIELSGGVYEIWDRLPDQAWRMRWVDKEGRDLPLERQPFGMFPDLRSPYASLPVQQVYVDSPGGCAWIPPRQGRLAWLRAMALIANDALALSIFQVHAQRVFKRSGNTRTLPEATGPSAVMNIDLNESVEDLTPSPAIEKLLDVLKLYGRFFSTSESLPGNELDPERQVLTGAALRVQLQPLIDLRENQVSLVVPDERRAFQKFRAVYNLHAPTWGLPTIDTDLGLELEVPDLETPATSTEEGNLAARQLALGTASIIDLISRETGATREESIKRYERVMADNLFYPSKAAAPGSVQSGPRMAGVDATPEPGPTAPNQAPDAALGTKPSVVVALKGA